MPPKKKRKVKQKTEVSAKKKGVLDKLGKATRKDAKATVMNMLGGGSCSNAAPLFVPGSDMVCNACGTSVKVVSLKTGETIFTLRGHQDVVTDLTMNPNIRTQFYSASLDRTVKLWDMNDGTLLQSYNLGKPCLAIQSSATERDILYTFVQDDASDSLKAWHKIALFDTRAQRFVGTIAKSNTLRCRFDTIEDGGNTAVVAVYQRKLVVWWSDRTKVKKINYERQMVTVAVQSAAVSENPIVATGDVEGRILLWYNLLGRPKADEDKYFTSTVDGREIQKTSLHWHAHAVTCMTFTNDGNYLLSGGEEAVLVMWQIGTSSKTFLPRLGAPLCQISVSGDSLSYGISTANNVFRMIEAVDMSVRWSMKGLAAARPAEYLGIENTFKKVEGKYKKSLRSGIAVDPIDGTIGINGVYGTGTLQIYNAFQDAHVATLEVAPRNVVSRTQKEKLAPTTVEHVCFSPDGRDLITVDRRTDTNFDDVVSLKFWERSSHPGSGVRYIINTRVESPHKSYLSSISYGMVRGAGKEDRRMVVSTSHDCRFKIWLSQCTSGTSRQAKMTTIWTCNASVFFRESPIIDSSFSKDGSLLAVGYSHIVTLWNPISNNLLGVLPHASISGKIQRTIFVSGEMGPYLLVITDCQCVIWDVIGCDVVWSIKCRCLAVGVDFESKGSDARFAIGCESLAPTQESILSQGAVSVMLFDASSPVPIYIWRLDQDVIPRHIHFDTTDGTVTRLVLMNEKREFFTISNAAGNDPEVTAEAAETSSNAAHEVLSSFNRLFGPKELRKSAYSDRKRKANVLEHSQTSFFSKVFEGASHVLPGLPSLFRPFMASMLRQNPEKIENDASRAPIDDDTSITANSDTSASNNENSKENVSALAKIEGLFSTGAYENGNSANDEKWLKFFGTLEGTKVSIDKVK